MRKASFLALGVAVLVGATPAAAQRGGRGGGSGSSGGAGAMPGETAIEFPPSWPETAVKEMLSFARNAGYRVGTLPNGRPAVFAPNSTPLAQTRPLGCPLQMHTGPHPFTDVTPYHNFFGLGGVNGGVLDNLSGSAIHHATLGEAMRVPRAYRVIFDPELWRASPTGYGQWNPFEVFHYNPHGMTVWEWTDTPAGAAAGTVGAPYRPSIVVLDRADGHWPTNADGTHPLYREPTARPSSRMGLRQRISSIDMRPQTGMGWGMLGAATVISSYASFIEQNATDPNVRLGAATVGVITNPLSVPLEVAGGLTRFVASLPNEILTRRTRDDFYLAYWANPQAGEALWNRYQDVVRLNRGTARENFQAWAASPSSTFAPPGRRDVRFTPQFLIDNRNPKPWTLHPRWSEAQNLLPR